MSEPRQFEIFYSGLVSDFRVRDTLSASLMIRTQQDDEYIKVIEYSAYDELQEKLKLTEDSRQIVQDVFSEASKVHITKLESEISHLRLGIKNLIEENKEYYNTMMWLKKERACLLKQIRGE